VESGWREGEKMAGQGITVVLFVLLIHKQRLSAVVAMMLLVGSAGDLPNKASTTKQNKGTTKVVLFENKVFVLQKWRGSVG